MADKRPRLVVLASHPIQYQAPLFRALAEDGRLDVRVLFLSRHGLEVRPDEGFGVAFSWEVDLLGGYRSSFVTNLREGCAPGRPWSYVSPGILGLLTRLDPDCLLFLGFRDPTRLAALGWARAAGVRCLYRADSSVLQRRRTAATGLARLLFSQVDGFVTSGTANDLYYEALGVAEHRRFLAPYSVDNAFFKARRRPQTDARRRLGLPEGGFVVLYSGKLTHWKDPGALIDACGLIRGDVDARVLVAGDGALRDVLTGQARRLGVPLAILGFVNQVGINDAYSAADVLVLPSLLEPWGLVVNEAMCHGLPVVVSSRVGARLDLVVPGLNGDVFPAGDRVALARILRGIALDSEQRGSLGEHSMALVEGWDLCHTVEGIVAAAHG